MNTRYKVSREAKMEAINQLLLDKTKPTNGPHMFVKQALAAAALQSLVDAVASTTGKVEPNAEKTNNVVVVETWPSLVPFLLKLHAKSVGALSNLVEEEHILGQARLMVHFGSAQVHRPLSVETRSSSRDLTAVSDNV